MVEILQIHYLVRVNQLLVHRLVLWDPPIRIMQIHSRLHLVEEVHLDQIRAKLTRSVVHQHHLVEHLDRRHFRQIKHHLLLVPPIRTRDLVDLDRVLLDQQHQQRQPEILLVHPPSVQVHNHPALDQPIRIQIRPLDLEDLLLDQKQAFLAVLNNSNNNSSNQLLHQLEMLLEVVLKIRLVQQRQLQAAIQFLVRAIHRMHFNNKQLEQVHLHLVHQHKKLIHLDHNRIKQDRAPVIDYKLWSI